MGNTWKPLSRGLMREAENAILMDDMLKVEEIMTRLFEDGKNPEVKNPIRKSESLTQAAKLALKLDDRAVLDGAIAVLEKDFPKKAASMKAIIERVNEKKFYWNRKNGIKACR